MKTIVSLMLVLIIVLSGCMQTADSDKSIAETDASSDSINDNANSESTRLENNVPDEDYEGHEFMFLTAPHDANGYWGHIEFYAEEINAVPLNDAIYERNAKIEDQFNIVISEEKDSSWISKFNKAVASGEDVYDCVPLTIHTAATAAVDGKLLDFSKLEYINLDEPWWDPVLNDKFTIANKLFFAIGDMTLIDKEATYIMMFNKDVVRNYNVEDLYQIVHDGKWTMSKLSEISSSITVDMDGNGKFTFDDTVGIVTDDGATLQAMFYTCGGEFFSKDSDDLPVYSLNLDHASSVIEKIQYIYTSQDTMLAQTLQKQGISNPWSDAGINGMFKQGRALFYGISLTVMNKMRDMNSDFGVIPYPKFSEDQKDYISFVYATADTICVPITSTDPVRTSVILESLCYESMYSVMPAYYDVTITNKTMRDEESAVMLDYIFDHRTMDLSQIYNWGNLYGLLASVKSSDGFVSSLKKVENSIINSMEKTIDKFADR